jgi:hypothetical protein
MIDMTAAMGLPQGEGLAAVELQYLDARDAWDRVDVARATGGGANLPALETEARAISRGLHGAIEAEASSEDDLAADDRRALEAMRRGVAAMDTFALPVAPGAICDEEHPWAAAIEQGGEALRRRVEGCFAIRQASLETDAGPMDRLRILARLAREPHPAARRRLFMALEPLWQLIDGDGGDGSPYRALVREDAKRWAAGHSPVAANALALGVSAATVETWAVTLLAAWRAAVVEPARAAGEHPIEPWDWWWRAGAAQRALDGGLTLDTTMRINRDVHAGLGVDLDELGVRFDVSVREGRPPIPVAFTTFGARPRRLADGGWTPGRPTVVASLAHGGLSELAELIHETGHAIHIAGIRTRPAFTDWPDSDAFTEALADLVSLDVAEPRWQRRWIPDGPAIPEILSLRCRYAEVALDAAWALFEIRQHAEPDRLPNDTWTEITSTWLGIARHPEWSWWAIRGQLVQDPGSMSNYAIGAVLAAALRTAIRGAHGDWIDGDPTWYPWVRAHIYRHGLERSSRRVLEDVLGGPPTADALLAEIVRGGRIR